MKFKKFRGTIHSHIHSKNQSFNLGSDTVIKAIIKSENAKIKTNINGERCMYFLHKRTMVMIWARLLLHMMRKSTIWKTKG